MKKEYEHLPPPPTIDESVDTFLTRTNLQQYSQIMEEHSILTMKDLLSIDNQFLTENKVSIGHKIKFLKEIEKL